MQNPKAVIQKTKIAVTSAVLPDGDTIEFGRLQTCGVLATNFVYDGCTDLTVASVVLVITLLVARVVLTSA